MIAIKNFSIIAFLANISIAIKNFFIIVFLINISIDFFRATILNEIIIVFSNSLIITLLEVSYFSTNFVIFFSFSRFL